MDKIEKTADQKEEAKAGLLIDVIACCIGVCCIAATVKFVMWLFF
jgi:hypothetical protein